MTHDAHSYLRAWVSLGTPSLLPTQGRGYSLWEGKA